jgi:hypothetical protein
LSRTRVTTTNSNLPTDLTFESIRSGLRAIIALGSDGKYYKIEQPKSKKVQITEIKEWNYISSCWHFIGRFNK